MGSHSKEHMKHKKHKTKDPEAGPIEGDEKKKKKHKKKEKHEKKERKRRASRSRSRDNHSSSKRPRRDEQDRKAEESSGTVLSLSVEDTNRLRAKLGLKPLQVDEPKTGPTPAKVDTVLGGTTVTVDGETFVHRRPESWTDAKKQEKLREKIEASKGRRKLMDKLKRIRGLGEATEVDSTEDWVARSRRLDAERKMAAQREALLAQMEEDFGVADLVQEEADKRKGDAYSSKMLRGLRVEHAKEDLLEGQETILVLKDQSVLEDSDETLVNPTLETQQLWKKNAELRKGKPGYNPYDDDENADDPLAPPKNSLLSKYDDEIDGEKTSSFTLDASGSADLTEEMRQKRMKEQLKRAAQSLELPEMTIAKEYYSKEEMATFKKPKKIRKKKLRMLKPDDLPESNTDNSTGGLTVNISNNNADLGSRASRTVVTTASGGVKRREPKGAQEEKQEEDTSSDTPKTKLELDYDAMMAQINSEPRQDEGADGDESENDVTEEGVSYSGPIDDEDGMEAELETALARARRMKALTKPAPALPPVKLEGRKGKNGGDEGVNSDGEEMGEEEEKVVLDSISEYCRGVGDATFGSSGNRAATEVAERAVSSSSESDANESDADSDLDASNRPSTSGNWKPAGFGANDSPRGSDDDEMDGYADGTLNILDEPDGSLGVAGTLKLAVQKQLLEGEGGRSKGTLITPKMKDFEAKRYSIMDKQFDDIDSKYARKLERLAGGGPTQEFKEKNHYNPEIKIEYVDETGKVMNSKQAFQFLSWKFHGKKPGKGKVEKYMKRRKQEDLLAAMPSTDTPLGTVGKQMRKLEETQSPFIVLSGTGKDAAFSQIKKD